MSKYSVYTAPNGSYFEQNDIDYLMNNGYSLRDALAELVKLDKYLNPVKVKKDKNEISSKQISPKRLNVTNRVKAVQAEAKNPVVRKNWQLFRQKAVRLAVLRKKPTISS